MVLIISSEDDFSTNEVIDWLLYRGMPFVRINDEDRITITRIGLGNYTEPVVYFELRGTIYNTQQISYTWYRRGWLYHSDALMELLLKDAPMFKDKLRSQLGHELRVLTDFLTARLNTRSINRPTDIFLNKLEELSVARRCGLNVPDTLITTSKMELEAFLEKYPNLITKNATPGVFVDDDVAMLNTTTKGITRASLPEFPDQFFPTLFQQEIEKKFELRIFYVEGEFYASAIFSQQDEQTRLDFRNYNFDRPNRTPPYALPEAQQAKLLHTMQKLNLNSGSIDCIIDKNNQLYFLEVNPVGQYGQVSIPCNYHLDEKIAHLLSR